MSEEPLLNPQIVAELLKAPDTQLDASMFPLIQKWSTPPTAVQILEVLDMCIHGALASGFMVTLLELGYDDACQREKTTHKDVVKLATWRY